MFPVVKIRKRTVLDWADNNKEQQSEIERCEHKASKSMISVHHQCSPISDRICRCNHLKGFSAAKSLAKVLNALLTSITEF